MMHMAAGPTPVRFGTSLSMKLSTVIGSTSLRLDVDVEREAVGQRHDARDHRVEPTPLPVLSSKEKASGQLPPMRRLAGAGVQSPVQHCAMAQLAGRVPTGPKSAGSTTAPVSWSRWPACAPWDCRLAPPPWPAMPDDVRAERLQPRDGGRAAGRARARVAVARGVSVEPALADRSRRAAGRVVPLGVADGDHDRHRAGAEAGAAEGALGLARGYAGGASGGTP